MVGMQILFIGVYYLSLSLNITLGRPTNTWDVCSFSVCRMLFPKTRPLPVSPGHVDAVVHLPGRLKRPLVDGRDLAVAVRRLGAVRFMVVPVRNSQRFIDPLALWKGAEVASELLSLQKYKEADIGSGTLDK